MTWTELAMAAGAGNEEEEEFLLWSASAFPFAPVRTIWYQLRHAVRHRTCIDNGSTQKSVERLSFNCHGE